MTIFPYSSFRTSMSHLLMELYSVWWIPPLSRPRTLGSNSASGARKRSFPIVMTFRSLN